MLRFTIIETPSLLRGTPIYRANDHAFDFEPRPRACSYSAVVNELEIMLSDEDRRAVFVTGYSPYMGWSSASLTPPTAQRGMLLAQPDRAPIPGMAIGVLERGERWPVSVDRHSGWVCIGDIGVGDWRAVEFAPRSIAVIEGDKLKALWLQPESLPAAAGK